ncbi:Cardiolipin synthase N-terminal domain-containing protein [Elizabethkingia occulta]
MDLSTAELIYLITLPVFLILGLILLLYSCWLILREKDDNNKLMLFTISILIPIVGPIFSIYILNRSQAIQ